MSASPALIESVAETYPPVEMADAFLAQPMPLQPPLIDGLLRCGEMGIMAAESKSFKTWLTLQAVLAVANGLPFLGRDTLGGRVLYCNTELQSSTLHFRLSAVRDAMRASGQTVDTANVVLWNLRNAKIGVAFGEELNRICSGEGVSMVCVDPIYPLLRGRDENSNGDMADLLGGLRGYCESAGAGALCVHHYAKGNSAAKSSLDRAAGAGAIARFADSMLSVSRHVKDSHFILEGNLRSFAPLEPTVLKWDFPLMNVVSGEDAGALRGGRPRKLHPSILVDLLTPGMRQAQLAKAAEDKGLASFGTARRLVREGIELGLWEMRDEGLQPCSRGSVKVRMGEGLK
jgi:hypothetical protein